MTEQQAEEFGRRLAEIMNKNGPDTPEGKRALEVLVTVAPPPKRKKQMKNTKLAPVPIPDPCENGAHNWYFSDDTAEDAKCLRCGAGLHQPYVEPIYPDPTLPPWYARLWAWLTKRHR